VMIATLRQIMRNEPAITLEHLGQDSLALHVKRAEHAITARKSEIAPLAPTAGADLQT
jgi:hypothetical protein